ncbi:hypothetical protein [Burkholderia vietnamiensis]|uniref:hypothetical protein n=1 Tax=Burkholderia vietnamiensis TaxID=60552 RepID=UPI00159458C6|nr:hypothetical protein [Burkholderia vietnamiensis]
MATKTPTEGLSPFTGYTIYCVKAVLLNNNDEVITVFDEHYEVCDDTNGLPIASDLAEGAAVSKAKAILKIRSDEPGTQPPPGRKSLRATKTVVKVNDVSVPTGCSVFQVKTVELDELDEDTGRSFDEYHEVFNDITGLPVAVHVDKEQATRNAISVLEAEALRKTLNEERASGITPPKVVI